MDLCKMQSRLEAKAKHQALGPDLFAHIERYEAIFQAIEAGLPRDTNDPPAKERLGYQEYFDSLEAQGRR